MGDTYRCVWVIREYPPTTEEQAILAQLADRTGVTLRLYHRRVTPVEEKQIVNNAARKNRLMAGDHDITQAMEAEGNLQDVQTLLATMRNNREILLHCSVYMELKAKSMETLEQLQSQIAMELTRAKITVDKLTLRQQEGFLSVLPFGRNQFGDQYERVLPAGSVANMYPLSFSGKTDPKGFYVGRDKYGTNILVDLDRRSNDKTNGSALILGNSGQGKSYLMKLLLTNFRESGKAMICLDVEAEYEDLTENLGGCYVDYMTGQYIINPLEPKAWSADGDDIGEESPEAFRKVTRLSQHIAFLKDFFRSYKDFTDAEVDTMEILLEKLYAQRGITDSTDFSQLTPIQYPVMAEFYWLCQNRFHILLNCHGDKFRGVPYRLLPEKILVFLALLYFREIPENFFNQRLLLLSSGGMAVGIIDLFHSLPGSNIPGIPAHRFAAASRLQVLEFGYQSRHLATASGSQRHPQRCRHRWSASPEIRRYPGAFPVAPG